MGKCDDDEAAERQRTELDFPQRGKQVDLA